MPRRWAHITTATFGGDIGDAASPKPPKTPKKPIQPHYDMKTYQTRSPSLAQNGRRLQTAVERIDEFLKRDREPYDREAINRALRIVFGDAPENVQPHQYEPRPI
jgi:hypothetical protein